MSNDMIVGLLDMADEVLKFTKIIFIYQTILAIAFGLTILIASEWFIEFEGFPFEAPIFSRLMAFDFLAFGFMAFLASRETEWKSVKIVVLVNMFFGTITAIGFIIMHYIHELPLINWTNIGSYISVAILYTIAYRKQNK